MIHRACKHKNTNVLMTLLANNIKINQSNPLLLPEKKKTVIDLNLLYIEPEVPQNVELLKKYVEDRSVWSPKTHTIFPQEFKQKILFFVLSQKESFKKKAQLRLPKPLLVQIVRLASITNEDLFLTEVNPIKFNLLNY